MKISLSKIARLIISLVFSFSIGCFFYLLVLQFPFISKSRLVFGLLLSLIILIPVYKSISQVWIKNFYKHKSIVLFAAFIGLFLANVCFYYPKISYLFYGKHNLEIKINGLDFHNTNVEITAFFTPLKSESYSQFKISEGKWERNKNVFSTDSSKPSRLTWRGWTGSEATIRFRKNLNAGSVTLVWDGIPQTIELKGDQDEITVVQEFTPPIWGKLLLWILSMLVTSYVIALLLWLDGKLKVNKITSPDPKFEKENLKTIIEIIVITILFLSVVNAFLPINPNLLIRDRDDGAFLYMGKQILTGKIPYLDIWDHKGPLIYYINAFGLLLARGNEWGVWFIQIIWLFLAILLLYKVISRLTGKIPALAGAYVLLLLIAKPLSGGNYVEEYALLPLFLCWFGFQKFILKDGHKWIWLVGFSLGLTILLRPNLISGQIGVLTVVLFIIFKNKNIKPLYSIIIGLVSLILPFFLYFYLKGAVNEMFSAYYLYNRIYVGSSISILNLMEYIRRGLESYKNFFWLIILSMVFFTFIFLESTSHSKKTYILFYSALFMGFFAEIWFSNLAPYQYKHYYIIWAAYFATFSSFLFAFLAGAIYRFIFSYFRFFSRSHFYFTIVLLIVGITFSDITTNIKNYVLDAKENLSQKLLAEISPYAECCSYLLIWGAEPQINVALDKDSPSRYFYQYALFSDSYSTPEMVSEFINDLLTKQSVIIDTSSTNSQVYPLHGETSPNFTLQLTEKLYPILSYITENYYIAHEMSNGWLIFLPRP